MEDEDGVLRKQVRVLLADSRPMESQLVAGALRSQDFLVSACEADAGAILGCIENGSPDIMVVSAPLGTADISALRTVHLTTGSIPKVVLLDCDNREVVVQAFRSGARGIFCLADSSFQSFCECIQKVHAGDVWASTRQLGYLLDSVCELPTLQVLTASGEKLLTSREEQVVALVSDGLSNRNIATELGISEHTVKKYLFRIFDKLGISHRVELVLYAVHHGASQAPAWIANA
jgi:DNA-binding NarL/FixJ family response regulator